MPEAHLRIVPAKARGHFELTVERLKIAPFQSALCSPQVRICARDRDEPPELHQGLRGIVNPDIENSIAPRTARIIARND